jgi:folate-binding protein YgfZ
MDTEIEKQYRAVRDTFGVMERSEVGRLAIRGADRFSWLQGMVSNDVRRLERGEIRRLQACVLNETGHILTDVSLIAREGEILAELPAANLAGIAERLDRYIIMEEVELEDVSGEVGCLTLQGLEVENVRTMAMNVCGGPYADLNIRVDWVPADYTGSGGFDLYFAATERERLEGALREILEHEGANIGIETQELLRMEAGIPKFGAELDARVIPLEANLGPTHISLTKGCYVGQEIIARIDARGHTNRALTGLVVTGSVLPIPGDKIFAAEADGSERETGRITSVAESSPAMEGRPIALGYVRHEHRAPGTLLRVMGEGRETTAVVTELPFYRKPVE